jgi:type VI secretion system protein ImpK
MALTSLFIPLMAYVQALPRVDSPDAQDVHARLQSLISQSREKALGLDVSIEQFNEALFPVAAWIDERLALLPAWRETGVWRAYMLQRQLFHTTLAGVQFFDRLEKLGPDNSDLREVFVTCLGLGFVGKFSRTPNAPEFTQLKQSLLDELPLPSIETDARGTVTLFPEAYATISKRQSSRRQFKLEGRLLTAVIIVVPLLILVAAALWFDHLLAKQVTDITVRLR